MTTVYYRRPKYTAAVPGERNVGRTSEAPYVTEASIDPAFGDSFAVGYGVGETAAEARAAAARRCLAAEHRHAETGGQF